MRAGDLSYWMDESFIYSLFVGMPAPPCLHHTGCFAFGGSACAGLSCALPAGTGVSVQVSTLPHETCQPILSSTLNYSYQKAYPARGPLAPNNAEGPSGVRYEERGCSTEAQLRRGGFSRNAKGHSQRAACPCDGGVHLIPKSKPFGSKYCLVSCRHWATCECENHQE